MAHRNVILVVIDSLRADHLSCYGYGRETTPTIDDLVRHGHLWEQAYSTCSWTKPSVASILTGLYPSEHGVLKGPKRTRSRDACITDALPDSIPHVAEAFTDCGWRCGAFFNNVQLERFTGFDRGFQAYEPVCGKVDRQLENVDAWIAEDPSKPFFAYMHLMESHWPYKPRRRHVEMFGGNRDTSRFEGFSALDFARLRRSMKSGDANLSESDVEDLVRLYDASVRRLDGRIKILLQILEKHGRANDTSLVITADHGEEFLDHGSIGHGHSLHVEVTRVPLVLYDPQQNHATRHDDCASLVDLPRTLLALGGADAEFPGCDLVGDSQRSPSYCELSIGRSFHRAIAVERFRLLRHAWLDVEQDATPLDFAGRVRRGELAGRETVRLYDMAADPAERQDLADAPEHAATVIRLTRDMDLAGRQNTSFNLAGSPQVDVDECIVERLRALGYID